MLIFYILYSKKKNFKNILKYKMYVHLQQLS